MIAFVSGIVVDQDSDSLVLDNQGIGYQIYCGRPFDVSMGDDIQLYTYHHIREDAMLLFGFLSKLELNLFKQIINVKGVGPKTGLNILSKTTHQQLIQAIDQEDIAFLRTLPGVGPKMASQMILDLRGKFVSTDEPVVNLKNNVVEDVFIAMGDLGFKRSELNSIRTALEEHSDQALQGLSTYGLNLMNARKRGV